MSALVALVLVGGFAAMDAVPEYIIEEQARRAAAEFLAVSLEGLRPGPFEPRSEESRLAPPSYHFVLASEVAEDTPWVSVNGATGEVWSMTHRAEKDREGAKDLSLEECRDRALTYAKSHWAHWDDGAELQSEELEKPWTPPPGTPHDLKSIPRCKFRWVVKEGEVQVGHVTVYVNATTGMVFDYGQWYYSAKGMPPAKLTAKQAQRAAWKTIPARYASRFSLAGTPHLRTRWAKGRPRLVWRVALKQSFPNPPHLPPDAPPHVHETLAEVDAHTGEVYTGPFPTKP